MKQNMEIEYKFLVNFIPTDYEKKVSIWQTYLYLENNLDFIKSKFKKINETKIDVCRLRIVKTTEIKYYLTLKSKGLFKRKEYECELTKSEAENLLKGKNKGSIRKDRYLVKYNDLSFEFDRYLDSNLITVEVEVQNKNVSQNEIYSILSNHFKLDFKDVTFDEKYKNNNLAEKE